MKALRVPDLIKAQIKNTAGTAHIVFEASINVFSSQKAKTVFLHIQFIMRMGWEISTKG